MNKDKSMNSDILSDEKLQLITGQIFVGQGILVAYQIGLFKLICNKPMTVQNIASHMRLNPRAIQALISCASALDLVELTNKRYQLSSLGKKYLDEKKAEYYGDVLDLLIQESAIMDFSSIKKTILTNKSQINNGKDLFENNDNLSSTNNFIKALHQKSFKPAFFWANKLDLSNHKKFIDIGGGSGIHSIAACLNNPNLNGTVCDRKSVLPFTTKYINDFNLKERIKVTELDMWKNELPLGDVHFFGDIFHDWSKDKCLFLAKKSFHSLSKNGKIILHEMLFNNKKTGPFLTAAYNMKMMVWTEGQQFSKEEIKTLLKEAGFRKIKIINSLGNWSLVVGEKS